MNNHDPVIIEVINEGKEFICMGSTGKILWRMRHPVLHEWRDHRNYGNGRYTEQDLSNGMFLGGCIKDEKAILAFELRSLFIVNITYDASTGELMDIHEAR